MLFIASGSLIVSASSLKSSTTKYEYSIKGTTNNFRSDINFLMWCYFYVNMNFSMVIIIPIDPIIHPKA